MTIEDFNALPLEARRYIETQTACLTCGKSKNLDLHYKNYLRMKTDALFTLRGGALSYFDGFLKKAFVLYPLHPDDTPDERLEKLKAALKVAKKKPEFFISIAVLEIEAEIKDLTAGLKGPAKAKAAEEAAAEAKAAEEAAAEAKAAEEAAAEAKAAEEAAAEAKAAEEAAAEADKKGDIL
jgi:hypothetical protein